MTSKERKEYVSKDRTIISNLMVLAALKSREKGFANYAILNSKNNFKISSKMKIAHIVCFLWIRKFLNKI